MTSEFPNFFAVLPNSSAGLPNFFAVLPNFSLEFVSDESAGREITGHAEASTAVGL